MPKDSSIIGFKLVTVSGFSQARAVSHPPTMGSFYGKRLCIPKESASDFVLVEYGVDRSVRRYPAEMKVGDIPCGVFASPSENRDPPDGLIFPPLLGGDFFVLVIYNRSNFVREFRACVVGSFSDY